MAMQTEGPLNQPATRQDLIEFKNEFKNELKQVITSEVGAILQEAMIVVGRQFQTLQNDMTVLKSDVKHLKISQARIERKLDHTIAQVQEQGGEQRLLKAGFLAHAATTFLRPPGAELRVFVKPVSATIKA